MTTRPDVAARNAGPHLPSLTPAELPPQGGEHEQPRSQAVSDPPHENYSDVGTVSAESVETVESCRHTSVATFSGGDAVLWACSDCRIRFYPHDAAERSDAGSRVSVFADRLRIRVLGLRGLPYRSDVVPRAHVFGVIQEELDRACTGTTEGPSSLHPEPTEVVP